MQHDQDSLLVGLRQLRTELDAGVIDLATVRRRYEIRYERMAVAVARTADDRSGVRAEDLTAPLQYRSQLTYIIQMVEDLSARLSAKK